MPATLPALVGKYPGDILWATMIFTILATLRSTSATIRLSTAALALCFCVEFLKLVPSETLESFRYTTFGHLILGHTFHWQNLIAYSIGVVGAAASETLIYKTQFSERFW